MFRRLLWVTSALVAASASGGAAIAQGETASAAESFGEITDVITVTARKREESIKDVPISLAVTTGAEIQRQGIDDLQELSQSIPAVNISQGGASEQVFIRGIGSGFNSGFEQSVALIVDGVAIGRSRATRSTFADLDRVEVLKGPQSIFFGANTIAGAINVTTASPDIGGAVGGYALGSYEFETEQYLAEGAFDLSLGERAALRVAGRYSDSEGFTFNENLNRTQPANEDFVLRGTLALDVTENLSATLKATYNELDGNTSFNGEIINCVAPSGATADCLGPDGQPVEDEANFVTSSDEEFRELEFFSTGLTLDYEIGEYTLTSVTGYYDQSHQQLFDLDFTDVPTPLAFTRFAANQTDDANQISQEVRIASPLGRTLEWVGGVYFQDEELEFVDALSLAFAGPTGIDQLAIAQQDATTTSVFGAATYNITDRLLATLGLRYINVDKDFTRSPSTAGPLSPGVPTQADFVPFGPPGTAVIFESASRSDDDVLPSLELQYRATDEISVYGKFSQGFKAGGFDTSASPAGVTTGFIREFDPEQVDAFELGAKGFLLDGDLDFNLALFRSEFIDQQFSTLVPDAGLTFEVGNVASSISQGIEFDFDYDATEWIEFFGAVTFLDSEFDEFPTAGCFLGQTEAEGCVGGVQDLSGRRTQFAPEISGNIGARLMTNISRYELTIEPRLTFSDDYFFQADLDPDHTQGSFEKIDLRVTLSDPSNGWDLAFVGRNLTDELTFNFCNDVPAGNPGSSICSPEPPATYTLQARYDF